jgi:hypothetical protein
MTLGKVNKKSRDWKNLEEKAQVFMNALNDDEVEDFGGVFGGIRQQPVVKRLGVESEKIIGEGIDNNAFIVIGNDRVDSPHTGYGGYGHTQCDSIDIVAGMGGHEPEVVEKVSEDEATAAGINAAYDPVYDASNPERVLDAEDPTLNLDDASKDIYTNPHFFVDAARVYISQKTNIDKNFGIGDEFGKTREKARNQEEPDPLEIGKYGAHSGIAVKADHVRIIGRETIRLVTGTDAYNSQGGAVDAKHGIEIIANNETATLQPMVLGEHAVEAMVKLSKYIEATLNIFEAQMHFQQKFNKAVMNHDHISAFFAIKTLPSERAIAGGIQENVESMVNTELSCMSNVSNMKGFINNYLMPNGPKYILSANNKVN